MSRYERYKNIIEEEYKRVWNIENWNDEIKMDEYCFSLLLSSFTMTSVLLYIFSFIFKELKMSKNINDGFFFSIHCILFFLTLMKLFVSFSYTGNSFSSCTDGVNQYSLYYAEKAMRNYYSIYLSPFSILIFMISCISIYISIEKNTYLILFGDILNILPSIYPYFIRILYNLCIYIPGLVEWVFHLLLCVTGLCCCVEKIENKNINTNISKNENPLVVDTIENMDKELEMIV